VRKSQPLEILNRVLNKKISASESRPNDMSAHTSAADEAPARFFFFLDPPRAPNPPRRQTLRQATNIRFEADQSGAFVSPRTSRSARGRSTALPTHVPKVIPPNKHIICNFAELL
jgi:hypothetical protein